jgi:UDP-N-acetylglucosamine--N-acetylmuramyl-(pentapeptide) pyrophosphoryl-undecaprenol N-acetylglucosamine transferase
MLVMAGGTGGHVFPALAVARNLRARGVDVVWLGTRDGLEARLVPAAGFDIEWISIRALRGKGLWGMVRMPFLVLAAMVQSVGVILRRRPNALLGMGGFVAGPGGLVAWLLRRPLVIHEANAIAGFTNRMLSYVAERVLTGFPGTFGARRRVSHVGNPVRAEIAALPDPEQRLAARAGPLRLLVVGGSLGARALNEVVPVAAAGIAPGALEIRHQCGRGRSAEVEAAYAQHRVPARVTDFIEDMAEAYRWADLVLCRAGAMTVAEIAAAGQAALFVPFPYAVSDHQAANAAYLAERGAALMVRQPQLTPERLRAELLALAADRARILSLARNARALAMPRATDAVAQACLEVCDA